MYNQYLILGEAQHGREDEFADWYIWVHTRDVMRPRLAAIAAQCFKRADLQFPVGGTPRYRHRFLCLYENSDPEAMSGSQSGQVPGDMLISSAADHKVATGGGYYDTVIERTHMPGQWPDADLVAEWIERPEVTASGIQDYVETRFAALLGEPGIVSGWIGKASAHQIYEAPRPAYVALYRTTALDDFPLSWSEVGTEGAYPAGWSDDDLSVTCFRQISRRITRNEVLEPDAASAAREAQARKATKPLPM